MISVKPWHLFILAICMVGVVGVVAALVVLIRRR